MSKEDKMTRDEITNMPAGRELDALVAEKVMGWYPNATWSPSTDIASAWQVINILISLRKRPRLMFVAENEWKVYFDIGDAEAYGSIASLAICRAALLAVMEAK